MQKFHQHTLCLTLLVLATVMWPFSGGPDCITVTHLQQEDIVGIEVHNRCGSSLQPLLSRQVVSDIFPQCPLPAEHLSKTYHAPFPHAIAGLAGFLEAFGIRDLVEQHKDRPIKNTYPDTYPKWV